MPPPQAGTTGRQFTSALDSGDMAPNDPQTRAFVVACNDLHGRAASWSAMQGKEIAELNALLSKNGLKPVTTAKTSELTMPVCSGAISRGGM